MTRARTTEPHMPAEEVDSLLWQCVTAGETLAEVVESEELDLERLVWLLTQLRGEPGGDGGAIGTLKILADSIAADIAGRMEGRTERVGAWSVERHRNDSRSWDTPRLAPVVARSAVLEWAKAHGGEFPAPAEAADIAAQAIAAAARVDWRVTVLRDAHGLDANDYSDRKQGRWTVQLRKAEAPD